MLPVRIVATIAVLLMPLSGTAAGAGVEAPSNYYQLTIDEPSMFRLAAAHATRPVADHPAAKPARFASRPYADLIYRAALDAALDPALVHAVIEVESAYNPAARSPKGAVGLMQVMPDTASRYGVLDPGHSVEANLKAGTRYLRDLMRQFNNRLELVLAAYNAGENAVVRYGERIPPYRETRAYVPAVLSRYQEWQKLPSSTVTPGVEYVAGTRLDPKGLASGH